MNCLAELRMHLSHPCHSGPSLQDGRKHLYIPIASTHDSDIPHIYTSSCCNILDSIPVCIPADSHLLSLRTIPSPRKHILTPAKQTPKQCHLLLQRQLRLRLLSRDNRGCGSFTADSMLAKQLLQPGILLTKPSQLFLYVIG